MPDSMPKVYFHIPSQDLIGQVRPTIEGYWKWINEFIRNKPVRCPKGKLITFGGPYNWTVQTFIYLRMHGFPCELTPTFPSDGIIITHTVLLPRLLKPSARQFIVEIKPDRYLGCIFSNFVIVQNRRDPVHGRLRRFLIKSACVNNWPQPELIPRDPNRRDRFENICYMGGRNQFLEEVDVLEAEIKRLGLNWRMMPREKWHDYSEVDAVVAVRPIYTEILDRKPATKLTNAWQAGVPAILSPDIAFKDIKKSDLDYLEASDIPEVIKRLEQLMDNPALRRAMMENGRKRAEELNPKQIAQTWIDIIQKQIIPEYIAWTKSPLKRTLMYSMRMLVHKTVSIDSPSGSRFKTVVTSRLRL